MIDHLQLCAYLPTYLASGRFGTSFLVSTFFFFVSNDRAVELLDKAVTPIRVVAVVVAVVVVTSSVDPD